MCDGTCVHTQGRVYALNDVWIRPPFGGKGRKMTGQLEAHANGFRYSLPQGRAAGHHVPVWPSCFPSHDTFCCPLIRRARQQIPLFPTRLMQCTGVASPIHSMTDISAI